MLRDHESTAHLVRHMASDAAPRAVDGAHSGMFGYRCTMAPQACFLRSGDQHRTRGILMGVMAVDAGDLTARLAPAFAIFQRRYLV